MNSESFQQIVDPEGGLGNSDLQLMSEARRSCVYCFNFIVGTKLTQEILPQLCGC
jgi:hypothetical protein